LFWEKSTVGWLLVAGLLWEKNTVGWWLISQANMTKPCEGSERGKDGPSSSRGAALAGGSDVGSITHWPGVVPPPEERGTTYHCARRLLSEGAPLDERMGVGDARPRSPRSSRVTHGSHRCAPVELTMRQRICIARRCDSARYYFPYFLSRSQIRMSGPSGYVVGKKGRGEKNNSFFFGRNAPQIAISMTVPPFWPSWKGPAWGVTRTRIEWEKFSIVFAPYSIYNINRWEMRLFFSH
jgi:hypothetical protein